VDVLFVAQEKNGEDREVAPDVEAGLFIQGNLRSSGRKVGKVETVRKRSKTPA
jgi:hypothetical protein